MSLNNPGGMAMAQAQAMENAKKQAQAQINQQREILTKRTKILQQRIALVEEQRDARKQLVSSMSAFLVPCGTKQLEIDMEVSEMPWPQQMLTAFIRNTADIHYADSALHQLTLDEMASELEDITARLSQLDAAESQLHSSLLIPQFNPLAN